MTAQSQATAQGAEKRPWTIILVVIRPRARASQSLKAGLAVALAVLLLPAPLPAWGGQAPRQTVKPMAGPRATALQVTPIYVQPDPNSAKVERLPMGREMVVAEKSGPWLRVFANTGIEDSADRKDLPDFGGGATPPPVSGWIEARGIVVEGAPGSDQVLMGAAASEELLASDPRGPVSAARSARLLYRRVVEMFPDSPLVPEAMWRAADIEWQIEKADAATRPSAREQAPDLRDRMDEDELKKVIRYYPRSRWAALAAYDLIDNKLCGDWQGQEKCPEKESGVYERYAGDYPDGPKTAQALYRAAYRQAALAEMYETGGNRKRSADARHHACALAARLKDKFPQTDSAWRAAALVYKLDEGIPVYGIDLN